MKERGRMNNKIIYHPLPPPSRMTCCLWKALECRRDRATVKQTMLKGPLPVLWFNTVFLTDFQERRSSVSRLMATASQITAES